MAGRRFLAAKKPSATKGPLLDQTFEAKEGGWIAFGAGGQVRITTDAARVKTGKPALAFDYKIEPGQFAAAVLPVPARSLEQMKRLKFWLKTDGTTAIAVILSEKKPPGGNYSAVIWSPKDTWQEVDLTPDDFAPSEGPTDPEDLDGKLDLDQIEGVGLLDLGQLFGALEEKPGFPIVIEKRSGPHTFYVDDFQALAAAPSAASLKVVHAVMIDDFHRPTLNWLTLGGVDLSLSASGSPLAARALQAQYEQSEGRLVLISHPLGALSLRNTSHLDFEIASAKDAQIVISLEKRKPGSNQGPRYNITLEVPGNSKRIHEAVAFADFTVDENGPADREGKLIPDQIKSISLTDITAAFTHEPQKNTIWIAQMQADGSPGSTGEQSSGVAVPAQAAATAAQPSDMGPMVMKHDESSHVTETMASHHMHMGPHMKMTEPRPANPEDMKRADAIVKTLQVTLKKYADYRAAIKDGYLPYLPNLPQAEYHFTNYGYGYQEALRFDPTYPTSLLYKKIPDGYTLIGAMYTAPDRATEDALNARVPLSVANWHLHVNICMPPGGMTRNANWMKFGPGGSISTEEECAAAGGKFMPHLFGWMVHVYPFEKTPENMWPH